MNGFNRLYVLKIYSIIYGDKNRGERREVKFLF